MEDEHRSLPKGWVRTFDPSTQHQFYVDTTKDPPRSIWHHPYDDEDYLATLSGEERERIEQESMNRGRHPSKEDIMAAHSEDDEDHTTGAPSSSSAELPPRPDGKGKGKQNADDRSFGRKFKDKVTGSTHEQRAEERKRRAAEEQRAYEQHMRVRKAMAEAAQTGKPVLVGKDRNGKDVYVQPPAVDPYSYPGGMGYGGYGYPYSSSGMYTVPAGRYGRPTGPYGRPVGGGYGGGYGLPLALGGGLMGGLLLGDMMGGGLGGGGFGL